MRSGPPPKPPTIRARTGTRATTTPTRTAATRTRTGTDGPLGTQPALHARALFFRTLTERAPVPTLAARLSPAPGSCPPVHMADLVFFYGTLMTGFDRRRRVGIDTKLRYQGRGWINAALVDLCRYQAAVPANDGRVWGEVFELLEPSTVLPALDEV